MKVLREILNWIIFGNFFIAFVAVTLLQANFIFYKIPLDIPLMRIVFLATFCTYNYSCLNFSWKGIRSNGSPRQDFMAKNYLVLKIIVLIAACMMLACFLELSPTIQLAILFQGLIAFLYYFPFLRYKGNYFSLRKIPGLKIWVISFLWAFSCSSLPWIEWQHFGHKAYLGWKWVSIAFANILSLLWLTATLFDIRDIDQDKKNGVFTLPVLLGIRNIKILSFFVLILTFLLNINYIGFYIPWFWAITLTEGAIIPLIILSSPKRSDYFYMLGVDSILIMPYFILLIFRLIS